MHHLLNVSQNNSNYSEKRGNLWFPSMDEATNFDVDSGNSE